MESDRLGRRMAAQGMTSCGRRPAAGGRKIFLPDGERYEGSTLDDARHGTGVCHYLNGDKYDGQVPGRRAGRVTSRTGWHSFQIHRVRHRPTAGRDLQSHHHTR